MTRHRLTDEQWNRIRDFFSPPAGIGRTPSNRRMIVDGILWILRTGAPWRDLPKVYGPWGTVWDLYDKWNADGTFDKILQCLQSEQFDADAIDGDLWCVDGSIVRAHRCAGGGGKNKDPDEPADHALGRSRGGFSTKFHILCDGHGHPLHFHLTAGQAHDSTVFDVVLEGANACLSDGDGQPVAWPVSLGGDKSYRADWIDTYLMQLGIRPLIPSKANENRDARPVEFDKEAYRKRNIVERLIGWLKESRRVFSRFDKTAKNFGGFLKMAFIHRYLKLQTT
jgi:transposase